MSYTYNRKLEQFQTKVQQSMELADDEISRLSNYLNSVKVEIINLKDQITRYDNQYIQDQHEKKGILAKEKSKRETQLAKFEAEHHAAVLEMNKEHAATLDVMQKDYEKTLAEIEANSTRKAEKELKKFDEKASKLETQISRITKRLNNSKSFSMDDEEEEEFDPEEDETKYMQDTLNIEETKIASLEESIKQRDAERLQSLTKSKQQLSDAVNALETLEKQHVQKMENYKSQIESIDAKYKKELTALGNGQKKNLLPSKKRMASAKKRILQLQQQIAKTEEQQNSKLLALTDKRDRLKSEFVSVTSKNIEKPSYEEAHEVERQADALRGQIESRESDLAALRSENQSLKREIGRLKHISRVAKRRSALGIE